MYGNTGYETKSDYDRARYAAKREKILAERPPDHLTLMTDTERAYMAGIIDGEGAVYIGQGGSQKKTVYPVIRIAMTDKEIIQWIASKFGNKSFGLHTRRPNHRKQWAITVSGKRAQLLCRLLLPYLITKRRHAELILEFPCDMRTAPGVHISKEINEIRFKLRDQINALNICGATTWQRRRYFQDPLADD